MSRLTKLENSLLVQALAILEAAKWYDRPTEQPKLLECVREAAGKLRSVVDSLHGDSKPRELSPIDVLGIETGSDEDLESRRRRA